MRRVLIAGCVAASLLAGIAQAGAYFTDRVSIADNVITAGSVAVSAEPTSSALSVPVIAPGGQVTRVVTVRNEGTLDANVVLTGAKKAGYTALYDALTVRVTHGTTVLYEGVMSALRTSPVALEAGASTDVTFELGLPPDADDGLQGDYVKLTLYVDAEQVRG